MAPSRTETWENITETRGKLNRSQKFLSQNWKTLGKKEDGWYLHWMNTITANRRQPVPQQRIILGKKNFLRMFFSLPHTGQESSSTSKRQWVYTSTVRKTRRGKNWQPGQKRWPSILPLPLNTQQHLHLRVAAPGKEERLREKDWEVLWRVRLSRTEANRKQLSTDCVMVFLTDQNLGTGVDEKKAKKRRTRGTQVCSETRVLYSWQCVLIYCNTRKL